MKITKLLLTSIVLMLVACQSEDKKSNESETNITDVTTISPPENTINFTLWAGEVQAKTELYKQPYYQDEYWAAINQDVDYDKIFNYIIEEVLSGRRRAYSILTEDTLSIETVKEKLGMITFDGTKPKPITAADLSLIRTRESWYFNEKEFTLQKKVSRMGFLATKKDFQTGEYIGDVALFYVYMGKEDKSL